MPPKSIIVAYNSYSKNAKIALGGLDIKYCSVICLLT